MRWARKHSLQNTCEQSRTTGWCRTLAHIGHRYPWEDRECVDEQKFEGWKRGTRGFITTTRYK
jgi:hypothetical protein